jgi:hypothetical protein
MLQSRQNGHKEVVRLLLGDPRVDPAMDDDWPIEWSCVFGFEEVVKLLLADPSARQQCAPQGAIKF